MTVLYKDIKVGMVLISYKSEKHHKWANFTFNTEFIVTNIDNGRVLASPLNNKDKWPKNTILFYKDTQGWVLAKNPVTELPGEYSL